MQLPIEAVERSKEQPRKRFDERQLEELAASIREHGVVEPILVRRHGERYRIVAGERRWRAAQRAGLKEIPALLRDARRPRGLRARARREPPAHRPERGRGGRGLRVPPEGARAYAGAGGRRGSARSARRSRTRCGCSSSRPTSATWCATGGWRWATPGHCSRLERADVIRRTAQEVARGGLSVRATEALVRKALAPPEGAKKGNGASADTASVRAVVTQAAAPARRALPPHPAHRAGRQGRDRVHLARGARRDPVADRGIEGRHRP